MADDNGDEDEGPVVELGEGANVEGAPLARVASRFQWPQQKSEMRRREGETLVRTPDGPRSFGELLDEVEPTYFSKQYEFLQEMESVVGSGPVPTE